MAAPAFRLLCLAAVLLSAPADAAAPVQRKSGIDEDISIQSKAAPALPIQAPAPRADGPIVDEVIRSLDLYRSQYKAEARRVRLPGGPKRLRAPFPEAPFLVFSPRLVSAAYQSWTFEVVDGGRVIWETEGTGPLADRLAWHGADASGETRVRVETDFYFRFIGKNGAEEFVLTSEPVTLQSLS